MAVLAVFVLFTTAACGHLPQSHATRHMVAAANPHAARAGLDILRAGGSAVDAAIAVQMVLTLVEPQSSGIGGGAFLIHFAPGDPATHTAPLFHAYDGRETAPASASDTLFLNALGHPLPFRIREAGGRSVGVPGVLRMLEMAHQRHGRLPWARLFEPAIQLAEQGFAVSPRLHAMIARDRHLKNFSTARSYFFNDANEPLPVGTVLRNPRLAATLRLIAKDGADAFYAGQIAADIAAAVGGTAHLPAEMTALDLSRYRARERSILCRPYRTWRVCGMPPPTSGGMATLQILGLLERFDMARLQPGSALAVHLISEASRLAFADRDLYLADPDFVSVPVEGLLDSEYLAERSRQISALDSMGRAQPGRPPKVAWHDRAPDADAERPVSTTHVSVIDEDGNAVAMTSSVGMPFGSRIMVHGFMLNDQLTDFAPVANLDGRTVANRPGPRKRPRSSMSPTIVTDMEGELVLTLGSPGGSSIIGYVIKTLIAALDWDLPLQDAIALPNHTNRNGDTELEKGTALERIAERLEAMGHSVRIIRRTSGLHGIRVRGGILEGGADPRREGVAIGD